MRDLSDLTLAGLTLTALMTFLTVEPPTSAPNRVSSALMGGGANIAYATAANHTTPAPIQANPNPATSPASRPEQRESKREGEVPAAVSPFTVPFPTPTPATIADIVEPAFEPMPSAREIVPTGQVDVRRADEQKASEQQTGGQAGAGSGFGDSRVPPLYDYDHMLAPRPATLLPDTKAAREPTSQDVDVAPPETAKYGDSRVPELAPMPILPTNPEAEMAPAQTSPTAPKIEPAASGAATTEQASAPPTAPEVKPIDQPAQVPERHTEAAPAKAKPCPKCTIPPEVKARQLAEIKARRDEISREQIAEAKAKRVAERAAEAKRSAKSKDDGHPIEYVSMDGAAFPMLGSMTPFAKPLHVEDDIRSVKLRNAMSVAPQDPRWAEWVEQVRSQKDQMAMLRLADEIIDHNVAYRDGTQNIWRDVDWTLRAGGVCKDYAIAKLRLLTDAGYPEDALRIVSMTPRTPGHDYHVVVMAWLGGKTLVLDMNDKSGKGAVIPLGSFQGERGVVWSGNLQGAHEFSRRQAHQSDERRVINVRETSGEEPGEKPATTASTETVVMDGKPLRVQRTLGDFVRYVAN